MDNQRGILLLGIMVMLLGCDSAPAPAVPSGWQTIVVGKAFTFRAPVDLKAIPAQGIDSLVGKYESPTLRVSFDYGRYSDPMDREGAERRSVTVDGKLAWLIHEGNRVAIHVPTVTGNTRLTMLVELIGVDLTVAETKVAETVVQSIRFP